MELLITPALTPNFKVLRDSYKLHIAGLIVHITIVLEFPYKYGYNNLVNLESL
jgi:hypothetical protein